MTDEQALALKPGDPIFYAEFSTDDRDFDLQIKPATITWVGPVCPTRDEPSVAFSCSDGTGYGNMDPSVIHETEADAIRAAREDLARHVAGAVMFDDRLAGKLAEAEGHA